jgi:hypothetical protein
MRKNVLAADVFLAMPGARPACFYAAIEAVRDVNSHAAMEGRAFLYNTMYWDDLTSQAIQQGKTAQHNIDEQLIARCEIAIVIVDRPSPATEAEFFRLQRQAATKVLLCIKRHQGLFTWFRNRRLRRFKRAAGAQTIFREYSNERELRDGIRTYLQGKMNDLLSEALFINFPMQSTNAGFLDEDRLVTSHDELMQKFYQQEHLLEVSGKRYAYASLSRESSTRAVAESEIVGILKSCRVKEGPFELKHDNIREKLYYSQILLAAYCNGVFRRNDAIVRFTFDGEFGCVQQTFYSEQMGSNLALFWPNDKTRWWGDNGLKQAFPKPENSPNLLGDQKDSLYQSLIEREQRLPSLNSAKLANTLGVGVIAVLSDGREQIILSQGCSTGNAVHGMGRGLFIAFALTWPERGVGTDQCDLWTWISEKIDAEARTLLKRCGVQQATVSPRPIFLGRELLRGGKPQLFARLDLKVVPGEFEALSTAFSVQGLRAATEIVQSREVNEELRVCAALIEADAHRTAPVFKPEALL